MDFLTSMNEVQFELQEQGYKKVADGLLVAAYLKECENEHYITVLVESCHNDVLHYTITVLDEDLSVVELVRPPDVVFMEILRGIEVRQLVTVERESVA